MHRYSEEDIKLNGMPDSHPLYVGVVGNPHVTIKLYSESNPQNNSFNFHESIRALVSEGARGIMAYPINVPDSVKKHYKKRVA